MGVYIGSQICNVIILMHGHESEAAVMFFTCYCTTNTNPEMEETTNVGVEILFS